MERLNSRRHYIGPQCVVLATPAYGDAGDYARHREAFAQALTHHQGMK